jgi:hypothetical protein
MPALGVLSQSTVLPQALMPTEHNATEKHALNHWDSASRPLPHHPSKLPQRSQQQQCNTQYHNINDIALPRPHTFLACSSMHPAQPIHPKDCQAQHAPHTTHMSAEMLLPATAAAAACYVMLCYVLMLILLSKGADFLQ